MMELPFEIILYINDFNKSANDLNIRLLSHTFNNYFINKYNNYAILEVHSKDVYKIEELSYKYNIKVNLSHTKIVDVSMLGNVHILDLSDTKVVDVPMLGNVHTLYLSYTRVVDVPMIGNVHISYI